MAIVEKSSSRPQVTTFSEGSLGGENSCNKTLYFQTLVLDTFQRNVAPHLEPYAFGALRWTYYKQSDVDRFGGPRPKETEGKGQ